MKTFSLFLFLLFPLFLLGEDGRQTTAPDLGIPAEVIPSGQYVTLKPNTTAKAITYIGLGGVDALPVDFLGDPRWFLLDTRGLPAGRYPFTAVGSLNDVHTRVSFVVVVGTPTPPSPGPLPPTPGPTPPTPSPNPPNPVIVPAPVSLLIVREVNDVLPTEQEQIIFNTAPLYMATKGERVNGDVQFRVWDDDRDDNWLTTAPPKFAQAYKTYRPSWQKEGIPYFILSNGKSGTSGLLPKGPGADAKFQTLLQEYGGN